jgi:hypothetical protein
MTQYLKQLKKLTFNKITLIFAIPIIILSIIGGLYYYLPLFSLNNLIIGKNPNQIPGIDYIITDYSNINKPTVAILIPNGTNSTQIIYSEFERVNFFQFNDLQTFRGKEVTNLNYDSVIGSINNKPRSEAVEIVKKYDLTKYNPDPKNINTVYKTELPKDEDAKRKFEEEARKPENEPFDLIDVNALAKGTKLKLIDINKKLKVESKYGDVYNFIDGQAITGTSSTLTFTPKEKRHQETQVRMENDERVKFIALKHACLPIEIDRYCKELDETIIKAVNIVLKDRTIIPVPMDENGYFDFEAVKDKWS